MERFMSNITLALGIESDKSVSRTFKSSSRVRLEAGSVSVPCDSADTTARANSTDPADDAMYTINSSALDRRS